MTTNGKVDVAVVGLGFGEEFLPVYRAHPLVGELAIVDRSPERLAAVGDRHGIEARYTDFFAMLADERWDAVHVLVPVSFHAEYSIAALEAGKHCACAVPMATEVDDLRKIVAAQQATGMNYMMMETTVFGREFRYVRSLLESGRLGRLTMYRGFHTQNLDGYPEYWRGYPPMKYVTHALSPILALTDSTVRRVVAHGSGRLTEERIGGYDNPFPAEVGVFSLRGSDVVAEIRMSFFQTARPYLEGYDVHGDAGSVEWPADMADPLRVYDLWPLDPQQPRSGLRGRRATREDVHPPDVVGDLPGELVPYLSDFAMPALDGSPVEIRKAEHGGSHPRLVHEFVSSIVEGRPPWIDAARSAAWTAPGICAHESAVADGRPVDVPEF